MMMLVGNWDGDGAPSASSYLPSRNVDSVFRQYRTGTDRVTAFEEHADQTVDRVWCSLIPFYFPRFPAECEFVTHKKKNY